MAFEIIWDNKASDEIDKLETLVSRRIVKKVKEMEDNPFSLDVKKLKGTDAFRLRIGDYGVVFEIEGNTLLVLKVGHRKDIYKN